MGQGLKVVDSEKVDSGVGRSVQISPLADGVVGRTRQAIKADTLFQSFLWGAIVPLSS